MTRMLLDERVRSKTTHAKVTLEEPPPDHRDAKTLIRLPINNMLRTDGMPMMLITSCRQR